MAEPAALALALLAGAALGAFFFLGLWWTTRRAAVSQHPALWFLASLLLRATLVAAGFVWASGGSLSRLLACLLGFVLAQAAVTWRLRPSSAASPHGAKELRDAP